MCVSRGLLERMRLTAHGWLGIGTNKPRAMLEVNGLIASKGIVFPDGTLLSSEDGELMTTRPAGVEEGETPAGVETSVASTPARISVPIPVHVPSMPPRTAGRKPRPRTNFAPDYQFQTTATGVKVGTTNPDYKLDVTGEINTATEYQIDLLPVLRVNDFSTFVGWGAGASGDYNSYFGRFAGSSTTSGGGNSFFGYGSGNETREGYGNAFFGELAGGNNVSGAWNAFFGERAGWSPTANYYNAALGAYADITPGVDRSTAIGAWAETTQNDTVILGSISGINGATSTASTGIATQTPNQYLTVGGGITVDHKDTNNGTLLTNSVLAFGVAAPNGVSGEAIASQRTASGGNQYGLDFYTLYAKRLSITNAGRVGIGTATETDRVARGKTAKTRAAQPT